MLCRPETLPLFRGVSWEQVSSVPGCCRGTPEKQRKFPKKHEEIPTEHVQHFDQFQGKTPKICENFPTFFTEKAPKSFPVCSREELRK